MIFNLRRRSVSSVVGLDLGSHSIKVVEIDHSGKAPLLVNYGITELLPGAVVNGQIKERDAVLEAINVLFDSCQITGRQVNIALNGADVIIKTIKTDRMNDEELAKAITWEAEQQVPFPLSEISMDYQVLDPDTEGEQMNVLLVAAKRDLINEKLSLLEEAGFDVLLLDVDTFCLLNALESSFAAQPDSCHCIVHFGNESTHLGLVRGGLPILTRNLPVGGRKLVDIIQDQMGIDEDQAYMALYGSAGDEELLEGAAVQEEPAESPLEPSTETSEPTPGEPPAQSGDISPYIDSFLDDVSIGVNRAAAFLESTEESGSITTIYLSGGCANISDIDRKFEEKVGIPTIIANPLSELSYKAELFQAEPAEKVAATLMLAIGLGLRVPD
ncbi:MAG: type IV pilus assembly protein PilM [Candidatus Glassbacteria bacterium]|nr:type IV pilus assembly protein PilM [Candidatus Glassbacteria bacterium]